jgi:hypothetical protein
MILRNGGCVINFLIIVFVLLLFLFQITFAAKKIREKADNAFIEGFTEGVKVVRAEAITKGCGQYIVTNNLGATGFQWENGDMAPDNYSITYY